MRMLRSRRPPSNEMVIAWRRGSPCSFTAAAGGGCPSPAVGWSWNCSDEVEVVGRELVHGTVDLAAVVRIAPEAGRKLGHGTLDLAAVVGITSETRHELLHQA